MQTVVPVTESPHTLHGLAHRAGLRERGSDGWWGTPIMTALAAVAASQHPPSHREHGAEALDALDRWVAGGQPRRVSGDGAAVCLAARAAAALGRSSSDRAADAIARLTDMASRGTVPELHLALAAWSLDQLVPDRRQQPWTSLRDMQLRHPVGVDQALAAFTRHLAAEQFDAASLVRELTASGVGVMKPGPDDGAVLLWLMTAVIAKATPYLRDDNALHALADQRTDLTARLALELGEGSFLSPGRQGAPDEGAEAWDGPFISPMEALLIDIALCSPERDDTWLTYPEARVLFGDEASEERRDKLRWRARTAAAVIGAGSAAATCTWLLARHFQGFDAAVSGWAAVFVFASLAFVAARAWQNPQERSDAGNALSALAVAASVTALVLTVNSLLPTPFLDDAVAVYVGVVVPPAAAAIVATRRRRG